MAKWKLITVGILILSFLACSPSENPPNKPDKPMDNDWSWLTLQPEDIAFLKKTISFDFYTLEYGIYAHIDQNNEGKLRANCEALELDTKNLARLIANAEPISLAEGRHGFDRGIDHCMLTSSVFIHNHVYDLQLSAFGVGVLRPAIPNNEQERYFLIQNCDYTLNYIQSYFKETGQHPGLHEFKNLTEMTKFFCRRTSLDEQ